MYLPIFLLWVLASWVLIIFWLPDPPPDWVGRIAGLIGGVAGGFLFNMAWPVEHMTGVDAAATVVGAFIGAGTLFSVARMAMGGKMSGR